MSGTGGGGDGGHRVSDGLRRIGEVFRAPQTNFSEGSAAPGSGFGFGSLLNFVGGGPAARAPAPSGESRPDTPIKLPPVSGGAADAAWKSLDPIPPRDRSRCPDGVRDLGVVLFIHDVETKRRDFAIRSDVDRWWVAVHNVTDLIEALRSLVGSCATVRGIMISAHGASSTHGGFRMGDDTDGDGEIEPSGPSGFEARDLVTSSDADEFGALIRNAIGAGGFVAVEACSSAGNGNSFLTALQTATSRIAIGAPGTANLGGNTGSGAWWTAMSGRVQVAADGTVSTDATTRGTGVWRPF